MEQNNHTFQIHLTNLYSLHHGVEQVSISLFTFHCIPQLLMMVFFHSVLLGVENTASRIKINIWLNLCSKDSKDQWQTFSGTDFQTLTLWSSYFYSVSHDLCNHCLCLSAFENKVLFCISRSVPNILRHYEITWGKSAASAEMLQLSLICGDIKGK